MNKLVFYLVTFLIIGYGILRLWFDSEIDSWKDLFNYFGFINKRGNEE